VSITAGLGAAGPTAVVHGGEALSALSEGMQNAGGLRWVWPGAAHGIGLSACRSQFVMAVTPSTSRPATKPSAPYTCFSRNNRGVPRNAFDRRPMACQTAAGAGSCCLAAACDLRRAANTASWLPRCSVPSNCPRARRYEQRVSRCLGLDCFDSQIRAVTVRDCVASDDSRCGRVALLRAGEPDGVRSRWRAAPWPG